MEQEWPTCQATCTIIRSCSIQRPKWITVKAYKTLSMIDQQSFRAIKAIKKATFVQGSWMRLIQTLQVDCRHLKILTRLTKISKPPTYWCSSFESSRSYRNQEVKVKWHLPKGACQNLNKNLIWIKVKCKIDKSKEIYLLNTIVMILKSGLKERSAFQTLHQRFSVRIIMQTISSTLISIRLTNFYKNITSIKNRIWKAKSQKKTKSFMKLWKAQRKLSQLQESESSKMSSSPVWKNYRIS